MSARDDLRDAVEALLCLCHESVCPVHNEAADRSAEYDVPNLAEGIVALLAEHPAPEPPSACATPSCPACYPSGGEVTAEELADAVLPRLANVSNLPEWMQIAALGRPVRPLATLVAAAILARFDVRRRP